MGMHEPGPFEKDMPVSRVGAQEFIDGKKDQGEAPMPTAKKNKGVLLLFNPYELDLINKAKGRKKKSEFIREAAVELALESMKK
jgi:hypothetical protein